ncbi:MAG: hypothetical protein BroJett011_33980 [Chloroflexota bacterium]|nr:MAG: hypothetical protein BroJett011_33980 [Chloroflexota bacterium]
MIRKANLYHKLVDKENSLTELLANLLQFPAFKEVFTTFLTERLPLPDLFFHYAHVNTQYTLTNFGIPDLVIENESFCIFIECKVHGSRKLTSHQPISYLKYLDTLISKACALVFLIPYDYEYEPLIRSNAKISGCETPLKIVYWNKLTEHLEKFQDLKQNIAIEHFISLLHARFDPIIFSKEDILMLQNKEFPALLLKLIELTHEIKDQIPKPFKTEYLFDEFGFGYYIKNQSGRYLLWFGCSYDFWKDYGRSLVIGVGDPKTEGFSPAVLRRFQEKFETAIRYDSVPRLGIWYVVPIAESLIEDSQNAKMIAQLIANTALSCNV